jgi:hypothetical protein
MRPHKASHAGEYRLVSAFSQIAFVAALLAGTSPTTWALSCPPGQYDNSGVCTDAPAGSYSPGGDPAPLAATPAPKGGYVPTAAASTYKLAELGFYVSQTGQSAQTPAPPGFFVDSPGASEAMPAQPGYFVAQTGQSSQTPAPVGSYVATAGATSAALCPADSTSFGSSPACRQGTVAAADTVSPDFVLSAGPIQGAADFSHLITGTNVSMDLGYSDLLTDLTLLDLTLDGTDAALFGVQGFTAGMVLHEGESAPFTVVSLATLDPGYYLFNLHWVTDQWADLGQTGRELDYPIGFQVSVPAPGTLIRTFCGLAVAGLTRRRCSTARDRETASS